jgi:deoxyribodipyrimidine photo-lyase
VDAGMRELWHTGWMHNRVRMVAASFLVKHLLISWQEGAAWFWDTLVDADLANNTFGWQWVAGCGADAAPYFRIFNPSIQARKFDPNGEYIRRWVSAYPPPVVNHDVARRRALAAFQKIREK